MRETPAVPELERAPTLPLNAKIEGDFRYFVAHQVSATQNPVLLNDEPALLEISNNALLYFYNIYSYASQYVVSNISDENKRDKYSAILDYALKNYLKKPILSFYLNVLVDSSDLDGHIDVQRSVLDLKKSELAYYESLHDSLYDSKYEYTENDEVLRANLSEKLYTVLNSDFFNIPSFELDSNALFLLESAENDIIDYINLNADKYSKLLSVCGGDFYEIVSQKLVFAIISIFNSGASNPDLKISQNDMLYLLRPAINYNLIKDILEYLRNKLDLLELELETVDVDGKISRLKNILPSEMTDRVEFIDDISIFKGALYETIENSFETDSSICVVSLSLNRLKSLVNKGKGQNVDFLLQQVFRRIGFFGKSYLSAEGNLNLILKRSDLMELSNVFMSLIGGIEQFNDIPLNIAYLDFANLKNSFPDFWDEISDIDLSRFLFLPFVLDILDNSEIKNVVGSRFLFNSSSVYRPDMNICDFATYLGNVQKSQSSVDLKLFRNIISNYKREKAENFSTEGLIPDFLADQLGNSNHEEVTNAVNNSSKSTVFENIVNLSRSAVNDLAVTSLNNVPNVEVSHPALDNKLLHDLFSGLNIEQSDVVTKYFNNFIFVIERDFNFSLLKFLLNKRNAFFTEKGRWENLFNNLGFSYADYYLSDLDQMFMDDSLSIEKSEIVDTLVSMLRTYYTDRLEKEVNLLSIPVDDVLKNFLDHYFGSKKSDFLYLQILEQARHRRTISKPLSSNVINGIDNRLTDINFSNSDFESGDTFSINMEDVKSGVEHVLSSEFRSCISLQASNLEFLFDKILKPVEFDDGDIEDALSYVDSLGERFEVDGLNLEARLRSIKSARRGMQDLMRIIDSVFLNKNEQTFVELKNQVEGLSSFYAQTDSEFLISGFSHPDTIYKVMEGLSDVVKTKIDEKTDFNMVSLRDLLSRVDGVLKDTQNIAKDSKTHSDITTPYHKTRPGDLVKIERLRVDCTNSDFDDTDSESGTDPGNIGDVINRERLRVDCTQSSDMDEEDPSIRVLRRVLNRISSKGNRRKPSDTTLNLNE